MVEPGMYLPLIAALVVVTVAVAVAVVAAVIVVVEAYSSTSLVLRWVAYL